MTNGTGIKDRYELPLTTESPKAAEHYIETVDRFLSQTYGADPALAQALEADDGFALAHAAKALFESYAMKAADARKTIAHARKLAVNATKREQQQVKAISLMIDGDIARAYRLIREHLNEFPRDMLMVRLSNRMLILGCSGAGIPNFPEELMSILKPLKNEYGEDWAFLGQYAFAHHETGYFDDALKYAERSLDIRPDNANASHSVAHVFFEMGDVDGGSDFLGDWLDGYDRRGPFNVHLSWHQALFQLATGRPQNAVSLYEDHIRPSVLQKNQGSLADSASLTWRMKIYGDEDAVRRSDPSGQGDAKDAPWNEIREIALPAAEKPGPAFRDAHAALAFAAGGFTEELGRMIDGLGEAATGGNALASEVTLPLVKGIEAFAHGAYEEAADNLDGLVEQLPRIGGSHAQREVFEDTILESYIRSGRYDKAQDLLNTRLKRRTSVRDELWLTRTMPEAAD